MNKLFPGLLLCAVGYMIARGQGALVVTALTDCARDALSLMLTLLCAYMLWCGLIAVLEDAGMTRVFQRALRPLMVRLFPKACAGDGQAAQAVCANLSANMLGLGNAATAQGVRAVSLMSRSGYHEEIGLFIVLNCSSVQLLPTTLLTLRAQYGAPDPMAIWLPSLLTTALTTLFAVAVYLLWARRDG